MCERLIRKWQKDSEAQEYSYMKLRVVSSLSNVFMSLENEDLCNSFCEYLNLIRQNKIFKGRLNPLLKVMPLVFFNVHKFYNKDVINIIKKNIPEVKQDKKLLQICFILYSLIFFLYSNNDFENSISSTKNVLDSCVEEKIFDNIGLFEFVITNKFGELFFDPKDAGHLLRNSIHCIRNSNSFENIFEILELKNFKGSEEFRNDSVALCGFLFGLINYDKTKNLSNEYSKEISVFFEYCMTLYR